MSDEMAWMGIYFEYFFPANINAVSFLRDRGCVLGCGVHGGGGGRGRGRGRGVGRERILWLSTYLYVYVGSSYVHVGSS